MQEWFERAPERDGASETAGHPAVSAPSERPAFAPGRGRRVQLTWATRALDALADRPVGALFWSWVQIVAVCGIGYWLLAATGARSLLSAGEPLSGSIRGLIAAMYFSAVTATSVGYGDITPVGAARLLAIAEAVAGLVLFGCVVSKFVSRRQERLIAEIHHIAFEDRLGRVRTNLHLVRTEVQATARLCEGRSIPPREAIARVESLAMVFVGELHAVHDLLYRPQQAPDEAMLEAILAGLASVFREFNELVTCLSPQPAGSPDALRASLGTMSRLARDICGDCVPHAFAPALRTWMDQIQRMSGELVQI